MNYSSDTTEQIYTLVMLFAVVGLVIHGCGDSPTDNDDDSPGPAGELTVEGSVDDYDLGEQELYQFEDFIDLIEGTIEDDGSFTVTFLGMDEVEEALKPVGDDTFEDFVGVYCNEEIGETLDSDHQFADVSVFNLTYGEDDDLAMMGLTSDQPNNNKYPPQGDHSGAYHVRWIFSSDDVSINETCAGASVDLDLHKGWNEVVFDLSDSDNKKQYTGERPNEVDWVIAE